MSTRIWHQSITDLTALPRYEAALREHVDNISDADTTVDLHGTAPGSYPDGLAPIEVTVYPWLEMLLAAQVVRNIIRAEEQGYHAVAISCFLDPGLTQARASVDIPVVSIMDSCLAVASGVAGSFGLIGLGAHNVAQLRHLAINYGYAGRLAGAVPLTPPITESDIDGGVDPAELQRRLEAAARTLVDAGAEVIIPAEGFLNTMIARSGIRTVLGIPVIDSLAATLAHAEMLTKLWRTSGLRTSHAFTYARPDPSLREQLLPVALEALR